MSTGKLHISIDSDFHQVQHLGEAIRSLCAQLILVDAKPCSVELAVVEAVNNSIEHAYSSEAGNTIDVTFEYDTEELNIFISDYGKPMPKCVSAEIASRALMPAANVQKDRLPESGWGLQLLKAVCDDVSYQRVKTRNTLCLSFKINSIAA